MYRQLLLILFGCILSFGLTSCEPENLVPDQSRMYTVYQVEYNKSQEKTSAQATFYLDEEKAFVQSRREINPPATIEYDGNLLLFNTDNRRYQKEFIGLLESDFVYTNTDDAIFTNSISMVDSISMFIPADSTSQQLPFYFEVLGNSLDTTETLIVEIESLVSEEQLSSEYATIAGLTIGVTASQLQTLGPGKMVIKAIRRAIETENIQTPTAGGKVIIDYVVQDTVVIF